MKDRIEFATFLREQGYKIGAEIGVADGRYSEILCKTIPELRLLSVDPFYRPGHYEKAVERLKPFPLSQIKRQTSIEASLGVADEALDFVFIDGNHSFDYVMEDIIAWSRKVRKGGIVAGHDYYHFHHSGVIEAVNRYVEVHRIELNLIPRSRGGHIDDEAPCWFFIKK